MTIDWKPIEEMPDELKDGRDVLVWDGPCRTAAVAGYFDGEWTDAGDMGAAGFADFQPTHYAEITPPS